MPGSEKYLFGRVGILGTGFMGASFAAALRTGPFCREIVAADTNPEHLRHVQERGIIDGEVGEQELTGCDFVVLAAPVRVNIEFVRKLTRGELPTPSALPAREQLVMDLGSTKQGIVRVAEDLPAGMSFIGGHPMAGSERDGPYACTAELFRDCLFVLTPVGGPRVHEQLATLKHLLRAFGARVWVMDPAEHDHYAALVSHLPHLVACALMETVRRGCGAEKAYRIAGQGFLDVTRIAAGNPGVWRDIFLENRAELVQFIPELVDVLQEFVRLFADGEERELLCLLREISMERERAEGFTPDSSE